MASVDVSVRVRKSDGTVQEESRLEEMDGVVVLGFVNDKTAIQYVGKLGALQLAEAMVSTMKKLEGGMAALSLLLASRILHDEESVNDELERLLRDLT